MVGPLKQKTVANATDCLRSMGVGNLSPLKIGTLRKMITKGVQFH